MNWVLFPGHALKSSVLSLQKDYPMMAFAADIVIVLWWGEHSCSTLSSFQDLLKSSKAFSADIIAICVCKNLNEEWHKLWPCKDNREEPLYCRSLLNDREDDEHEFPTGWAPSLGSSALMWDGFFGKKTWKEDTPVSRDHEERGPVVQVWPKRYF